MIEKTSSIAAFEEFEAFLTEPGPWIAGIDFPFGFSRRFIETIGWPTNWPDYVRHMNSLGKSGFISALEEYKAPRAAGDKEHQRATDRLTGGVSPQKLYGVPVAKMLFEGAPRLINSGASIVHLSAGDPGRTIVEAYPGVLARAAIGKASYKSDTRKKQTPDKEAARKLIVEKLRSDWCLSQYGFTVLCEDGVIDDPTGDRLDAVLCAVQAAWALDNRQSNYGAGSVDPLEGWIADPHALAPKVRTP